MPAPNPSYEELVDRLEKVEAILDPVGAGIQPGALNLRALEQKLKNQMVPEGDDFVLPQSVGTDSLKAVPHARMQQTGANQDIGVATHTRIQFNTLQFESVPGMADLASDRITIPVSGIYLCSLSAIFTGVAAGLQKATIGRHVGTSAGGFANITNEFASDEFSDAGGTSRVAVGFYRFLAGDFVEYYGYSTNGADINTFGQRFTVAEALFVSNIGD